MLNTAWRDTGALLEQLKANWRPFLAIHIAVSVLVFVLLAPLSALLLRILVSLSGDAALSDQDILHHILSPAGFLAFLVMVSVVSIIVFLEYAALITAAWMTEKGAGVSVLGVLAFLAGRSGRLFGLALSLLLRVLLYTLPFLVLLGGIYWVLLSEFDINFYLSTRPTEWYMALGLAGLVVLGWCAMILYLLSGWIFALPLLLLGNQRPGQAIAGSVEACSGHRWDVLRAVFAWLLVMVVLTVLASLLAWLLSWLLVPSDHESLRVLLLSLLAMSGIGFLESFLLSFVGVALLSLLIIKLFRDFSLWRTVDLDLQAQVRRSTPRLGWKALAGIMAVAVVVALLAARGIMNSLVFDAEPSVMAHRGASAHYPENTLAAIQGAIDAGAQYVEIDVQETTDGEIVVIHDRDLKKVGGVPLVVGESTLQQLGYTDIGSWFDLSFSDQRIPTLREVLALCKDRIRVNIELKYYGHEQRLEQSVAELVDEAGMADQVIAMSLSLKGAREMKRIRPDWKVGLLSSVSVGDLSQLDVDFLALNARAASRALVRRAHERGKEIMVWTVNDALGIATMAGRGVDAIITDEPALAVDLLEQRRELEPGQRALLALAELFDRPALLKDQ